MMHLRRMILGAALLWGVGTATPAAAAERLVLKYGALQRSVAVAELSTFAQTGETSRELRAYLRMAGQDPEAVRQALNREAQVNPVFLDGVLRTPIGDAALDRLSTAVYTGSRSADREAMRSALVLSVSDDQRASLIEVIENYPTQQVYVDGEQLANSYQQIAALGEQINTIQQQWGNFLEAIQLF